MITAYASATTRTGRGASAPRQSLPPHPGNRSAYACRRARMRWFHPRSACAIRGYPCRPGFFCRRVRARPSCSRWCFDRARSAALSSLANLDARAKCIFSRTQDGGNVMRVGTTIPGLLRVQAWRVQGVTPPLSVWDARRRHDRRGSRATSPRIRRTRTVTMRAPSTAGLLTHVIAGTRRLSPSPASSGDWVAFHWRPQWSTAMQTGVQAIKIGAPARYFARTALPSFVWWSPYWIPARAKPSTWFDVDADMSLGMISLSLSHQSRARVRGGPCPFGGVMVQAAGYACPGVGEGAASDCPAAAADAAVIFVPSEV